MESASPSTARASDVRTFLIADVRGYTQFTLEHGDEAAAKLATRFATLVEEELTAHDGQVIELRGDEALTVFASARRALQAAVELQGRFLQETERDPSLPMKVGIGLDAGEAVPVERGYRGAALNLAARLCALAGPGEVLASDGVIHLARKVDGLAYAERGFAQLKGFADPVRVVEIVPVSSRERGMERAPESREVTREERRLPIGGFLGALPAGLLVGREGELRRLLGILDVVAGGTGQLVLLAGEPGVGKTRLAQELTLALRNREFLVGTGRSYEPQQAVPFYPFLEALVTIHDSAPPAIRAVAGRRWPYLGRLLPDQIGPVASGAAEGGEDQQRLFQAVTGFLTAIAEEAPIALLLDDLHWADSASLALLQHLARHTRAFRILLLGTYRDVEVGRTHPLEQALRDLHREGLMEEVPIRRLDQEEAAALTAATFGEDEISGEFVALLHRYTEGNPFFLQEVLRALVERGDIFRRDGTWDRRDVTEIEVPKSIRSAIGERLSRLSEEAQEILSAASVLGQTFHFDDLQGMAARREEEVDEALAEASAAGLVRVGKKDGYAFNHALTQQVLYGEQSPRRRRRLHLAAGEVLEQLPERSRERRAVELAWHFLQGDDPERALRWSVQAGDQAEAVFAHAEAEHHYRTALELARETDDAPREVEALEKLGRVLGTLARYDDALALLERAAEQYRQVGDITGEIRVAVQIGTSQRARGTAEKGIERLQPMAERFEAGGPPRELAAFYATLERLYFASGQHGDELAAAERASQLARQAGDERTLALAEVGRGTALLKMGRTREGCRTLEDAIPLAERSGEAWAAVRIFHNLGSAYYCMGELNRSRECAERALVAAERFGNPWGIAFSLSNLGSLHVVLGDWGKARRYLSRSIEMARSVESSWWGVYSLLVLGRLQVVAGEWEEARQTLQESLAVAERGGDLQARRYGSVPLASLDLAEGQPEAAVARLEPLLDRPGVEEPDVAEMLPIFAEAHLAKGDEARAEAVLGDAIRRAREQNLNLYLVDALRVRGALKTVQDRWEDARGAFDEALALAHAMTYPHLEAQILCAYGAMLSKKGESHRARERLEEALAIFQRLGAQPYIERTARALHDLA